MNLNLVTNLLQVQMLIQKSASRPHPDFPVCEEMRQYNVLLSSIVGKHTGSRKLRDTSAAAEVQDAEAGSAVLEMAEKDAELLDA